MAARKKNLTIAEIAKLMDTTVEKLSQHTLSEIETIFDNFCALKQAEFQHKSDREKYQLD